MSEPILNCERGDGVCSFCGAEAEEDCPLTDLSAEIAMWDAVKAPSHTDLMISPEAIGKALDNDECESCQ